MFFRNVFCMLATSLILLQSLWIIFSKYIISSIHINKLFNLGKTKCMLFGNCKRMFLFAPFPSSHKTQMECRVQAWPSSKSSIKPCVHEIQGGGRTLTITRCSHRLFLSLIYFLLLVNMYICKYVGLWVCAYIHLIK